MRKMPATEPRKGGKWRQGVQCISWKWHFCSGNGTINKQCETERSEAFVIDYCKKYCIPLGTTGGAKFIVHSNK